MIRTALITGITGQDGSHLAELLIAKGYEVHGLVRRSSSPNTQRLEGFHLDGDSDSVNLQLHFGDMSDALSLQRLVADVQPDEVYNLAAQSHVAVSFAIPEYTFDITGTGAIRMLEAVRREAPQARYYQASSSEMFGATPAPQNELTRFHPRSPYAVAKVAAHNATVNYREAYGMFACSGILFNHEGERRGETFVTRKIAKGVAAIKSGRQEYLYLGNLNAKRDWGHAADYVRAMWMMLQADTPDDYVIATGENRTVQEFCEMAFDYVGLDAEQFVRVDEQHMRPSEVDDLCGDASKARKELAWEPEVSFSDLVSRMVESELSILKRESFQR